MAASHVSRRQFLKATMFSTLALGLINLRPDATTEAMAAGTAGAKAPEYTGWRQLMAEKWQWDRIARVTHCVDCYPGNCSWTAYIKDGVVVREEQTAAYPQIDPKIPDMNPRGCQKGASFGDVMYGEERIRYPLVRIGERGAGKWKRVSWDEALGAVADAMIEAQHGLGPESCVLEMGPGNIGIFQAEAASRFAMAQGMTTLDVDGLINDFNVGQYITFGKFQQASSLDDWFHSDVLLIWHKNPIYTRIPSYHFISEARYRGAKVVTIAPDVSPSTIHADLYVPVDFGADAALALGISQVLIAEKLVDEKFVKEQTDLPLLVRADNDRFLRASDLASGGEEDQLFVLDSATGKPAEAPKATLNLGSVDPVLDGKAKIELADGRTVEVRTVFAKLRERVDREYTPEKASALCGSAPSMIRDLARIIAGKRTTIILGWNSAKYYHGDLIERAQQLVLGLTGNWGTRGTGSAGWNESGHGSHIAMARENLEDADFDRVTKQHWDFIKILKERDPTMTEEMAAIDYERLVGPLTSSAPPVFYWYHHAGYREVWNKKEWNDPTMKRRFDDYMNEAVEKDWWDGYVKPAPDKTPQVLIGVAGSTLRRTRGGLKQLLENTWPKLKMIVCVDPRMSTTCRYSDVILPPAWFYEREDFRFFSPTVTFNTYTDRAVEPLGDTIPEWEIFGKLSLEIKKRASARGKKSFRQERRLTKALVELLPAPLRAGYGLLGGAAFERALSWVLPGMARRVGTERSYEDAHDLFSKKAPITRDGYLQSLDTWVSDQSRLGLFPKEATIENYKKKGFFRFTGLDEYDPVSLNTSCDIEPDKTIVALQWHVRDKIPYPTYTRRAQFYIDHEWFIDAGEAMPVHKPNPKIGGEYPFRMTSGHMRWSVHSIWIVNKLIQRTHRGRPGMFMNPHDAKKQGLADGELAEVFNDFNSFKVHIITSASVRPGQLIIYHAWEPYQFPGWKSYDAAIPGMVKYLHLAGDYGQLRHWRWNWQPTQSDRAVTVDVRRAA